MTSDLLPDPLQSLQRHLSQDRRELISPATILTKGGAETAKCVGITSAAQEAAMGHTGWPLEVGERDRERKGSPEGPEVGQKLVISLEPKLPLLEWYRRRKG